MFHKLGMCCGVLGVALTGGSLIAEAQDGGRMSRSAAEFQQSPARVQGEIPLQERYFGTSVYRGATQAQQPMQYQAGYGQPYGGQQYQPSGYGQQVDYQQQQQPFGQQAWSYTQQPQQQQYFDPNAPSQQQFGQQQMQANQRAGLGVSLSGQTDRGVLVVRVHPGSPAQQAGLRPGDQIVSLDGQQLQSVGQAIAQIQQRQPGESIQLQVLRNGLQQNLQARLESRQQAMAHLQRSQQAQQWQQGQQYGQMQQPLGTQQFQAGYGQQQPMQQQQHVMSQINQLEQQVQRLSNEVDNLRSQLQQSQSGQQQQSGYRGLEQQPQPRIQADDPNGNGNGDGNGDADGDG